MVRFQMAVVLLAVSCSSAWTQEKKSNDPTEALFGSGKVLDLKIEIGPKELDALRREPRKYATATLKEGDKIYPNIGVHVKGAAGSFRGIDDKPGLTLNMDKYVDDQRFYGMDKFHLANSVQDPSYLQELVCGELFRAAGVPASRISHAVVTINDRRRGLYYLKEGYDSVFLKRYFKNSKGNLYDGGFLRDVDQPLQLLSSKGDVANHADLKAMVEAAREPDAKKRFEKLDQVLDMDKFMAYLVLEAITWDWDGYPMNRNNYRIYHDPTRNKLIFFPSGMDQMFSNIGGPIMPGFQGLIANRVMDTPLGKERYIAKLDDIMKNVFKPEAIGKRLDELQAKLQPALKERDEGAARDLPNHINRLRQVIAERARNIEEQRKRLK